MKKYILSAAISARAFSAAAAGWNEMAILARPDGNGGMSYDYDSMIQRTSFTNALFIDFNNDGNLDLLIMASGGDWTISKDVKFMLLYENLGPEAGYAMRRVPDSRTGFVQAADEAWLNPITAGDVNGDGYTDIVAMTNRNGRFIDLYLNNGGDGSFTHSVVDGNAMTNGAVTLGDINGDGCPDILANGWSDDSAVKRIAVYLGDGAGNFTKTLPEGVEGTFEGHSTLADINGDGKLDIVLSGHGDNWARFSRIYLNTTPAVTPGAPLEAPTFTLLDSDVTGLKPLNLGDILAADFNADGMMDLAMCGNDGDASFVRMFYQTPEGKFELDGSNPIFPVNTDGGINMADWDGDGNMDIVVGGYCGTNAPSGAYSSPLRIYRNTSDANARPSAPASVTATVTDDNVIEISWEAGSDDTTPEAALRYNVMVRNESTGETFCLIPADPATGNLKVGTDLSMSVGNANRSYRVRPFGGGAYTVGVQTLDQSFAPSPFATASAEVSGIGTVAPDGLPSVQVSGNEILVEGDGPVTVYDVAGKEVAAGFAGVPIEVEARGVLVVKAAGHAVKVVK